ncbi:TPA: hypothetical protein L4935_000538 [Pseudomonas aeruginosa]|uniref:restriction endonuclease subunit S n=1 Tax=Pseudomonas aeruginosa TaxID=287 RepID=UPI003894AAE0|nr:hypothetical protein [Pseudomonas aeruginosa]HBO6918006.1 hypothetical protein [Pseudomonas aeruginosa]HBO6981747.1 hypothetical protein [Pseudomonas aeruginosa]HBO7171673.1 hypothetical protein [Pseudomonas aeruginosa]
MSELPAGWARAALGDLADFTNGKAFKKEEWLEAGKPIIRIQNLNNPEASFNYADDSHDEKYLVRNGDLLVSWSASLGVYYWAGQDAWLNQHIFRVHSLRGCDKGFLKYALQVSIDDFYAKAHGMGMVHITKGNFESHQIALPPIGEQTRIAQKLDELLAQIDTLKARIDAIPALLKRFRQSVLAAAVSGRLTEDWRSSGASIDNGHVLHHQIKEAHAAEGGHARGNASDPTEEAHDLSPDDLPKTWDIAELRDICVPGRPITYGILKPGPELDEGIPYIRVADFPGNKLNMANIKKTSPEIDEQFRRARLMEGDLLLSIRGSVGRLIKIPANLDGANITQDTARLSISPLVSTEFVYWALLADSTQRRMKNATRGVAVRGINIGDVRALQIPLPPRDEQTEIVRRVEQLFAFADQLEAKVATAQARIDRLAPSILAKAFRGELVPQDPNDEPASLLLERIQAQRAAAPKAKRGRKSA